MQPTNVIPRPTNFTQDSLPTHNATIASPHQPTDPKDTIEHLLNHIELLENHNWGLEQENLRLRQQHPRMALLPDARTWYQQRPQTLKQHGFVVKVGLILLSTIGFALAVWIFAIVALGGFNTAAATPLIQLLQDSLRPILTLMLTIGFIGCFTEGWFTR